jgi:hypothetical protein
LASIAVGMISSKPAGGRGVTIQIAAPGAP